MLVPLGLPIRGFARQIPIEALYNPVLGVYSSICRCGYPKVYPSVALEGKSLLKPHMTQYLESTWAYVASYVASYVNFIYVSICKLICRCGYPRVYPSVALQGKSLLKPYITQYLGST